MLALTASSKRVALSDGFWASANHSSPVAEPLEDVDSTTSQAEDGEPVFDQLPHEIVQLVFSYLDERHRLCIQRVNRQWQVLTWAVRESIDFSQWPRVPDEEDLLKYVSRCSNHLKRLVFVDGTSLDQKLARVVPKLTNLRELNVNNCNCLKDEAGRRALEAIGSVTTLHSLYLHRCSKLNPANLGYLTALVNLTKLDLGLAAKMTDDHMSFFTSLRSLTYIDASRGKQITADGLRFLAPLTMLKFLDLTSCSQIESEGLQHFVGLQSLERIRLARCNRLNDTALVFLAQLPNLRSLDVRSCRISDEGLVHLSEHDKLQNLDLKRCNAITARGIKHLAGLTALKSLTLAKCQFITIVPYDPRQPAEADEKAIAEAAEKLKSDLPEMHGLLTLKSLVQLSVLDLATTYVTDVDLKLLGHLPQLSSLRVTDCTRIYGKFLKRLRPCTSLVNLYLDGCSHLKPENFVHLAYLTSLQLLNLSRTPTTQESFQQLTTLVNLKTLYLEELERLTNPAMRFLQHLVSLQFLDLSFCPLISDRGVRYLSVLTNLRTLRFTGSDRNLAAGILHLTNLTVCQ